MQERTKSFGCWLRRQLLALGAMVSAAAPAQATWAARLLWLERHSVALLRERVLPASDVLEDVAPHHAAYATARTASPTRIDPPVTTRAVMPPWPRIAA